MHANKFKLKQNAVDGMILEKAKIEIKLSLFKARQSSFNLDNTRPIDHMDALVGDLPKAHIELFVKRLEYGKDLG